MNYKELQIKDISMFEHEFDEQIIYIEIAAKNGEQIYNTVRQLKETKNLEIIRTNRENTNKKQITNYESRLILLKQKY